MTSLKGILYIILPYNHSFYFLTVTPPTLHVLPQITILPFLSFFLTISINDPLSCINAVRAEPLFSLIAPGFACAGCRCALIAEDDGAYCHQRPVQSGSPSRGCIKAHFLVLCICEGPRRALPSSCGMRVEQAAGTGIPQKTDAKWLNQVSAKAAESSGERKKTRTGRRREAEGEE